MKSNDHKYFYTPSVTSVIVDIFFLLLSTTIVFISFFIKFVKYFDISLIFLIFWLSISYLFKRYEGEIAKDFRVNLKRLAYTVISVLVIMFLLLKNTNYNLWPIFGYSLMTSLLLIIYYFTQHSVKQAIEYKELSLKTSEESESLQIANKTLDLKSIRILKNAIKEFSGTKAYQFISEELDLNLENNLFSFSASYFDMKAKPNKTYLGIAILNQLNNIRGINKLLSISNQKIQMDGKIICCFESQNMRKKRVLENFPTGINYIIYSFDYITKRVIPKLGLTKRLYYDITGGRKRILSQTEVMGRLIYCGFQIKKIKEIENLTYIVCKKVVNLEEIRETKHYGAFVKLKRIGKDGNLINVYKFRTMYPYAEYIQSYVYETKSLGKGGKFQNDFRINTLGKFLRTYWLDELPMFINILKGNMKIVGVRPLSQQYYNLYSQELQEIRIRFKPGLFPPFYADLPDTLEEIQESEMKYLRRCYTHGVFYTDLKYFFLIFKNILFKKAKSA